MKNFLYNQNLHKIRDLFYHFNIFSIYFLNHKFYHLIWIKNWEN